MAEENVLKLELEKLDVPGLKRIAQVWNISNPGKEKKAIIKNLIKGMNDGFYVKGILEKLSAAQVVIYASILKSKSSILTLGEIARKVSLPPVNAEMELGVLKRYVLVYQRKNRERLTNNLDKYYFFSESGSRVRMDSNDKGQKFRISISKHLQGLAVLPEFWRKELGLKKADSGANISPAGLAKISKEETLAELIASLNDHERFVVSECFHQGGLLEIVQAREVTTARKSKWEDIVRKLNELGVLADEYYIDERFIRMLIMPPEIFSHLQSHPILPPQKSGTKRRQERITNNDLDFFLNLKKMIVYISRKGLNLAKSGKIKQADLRETENRLLRPDIGLFIEKSEIYQIELLLPVLRMLDVVRVKRDDVVLRNDYEAILDEDPYKLMDDVMRVIEDARDRRVRYEDVFEPLYVPFYRKETFTDCVNYIIKSDKALNFVIVASLIREKLVLSRKFRIKDFHEELPDLKREITSALFYMQLLGFLRVQYPDRWTEMSELGLHYLKGSSLNNKDGKGGIIINPDLSLIAIPEQLSLESIHMLKSFMELKNFDNIYSFQLTRESFQEGVLLKNKPEDLLNVLRRGSKNELSQNLLFSVEDWSRSLPLVEITDECVVVQTREPNHMELLLGQIGGKKIVLEEISPTTILIDQDKIYEAIAAAEKLNLIVRLVR